ncbi:MAG: hypothetical protein QOF60_2395 [Actinomycetota bacterium]|jgi:hypothetical protein|nr:hypothetical protein [Actinomycetota bacterium]
MGGVRRAGRRGGLLTALAVAVAIAGTTLGGSAPARAAVTGITPGSATIPAGTSTSATVKVSRASLSCLRVDTNDAPGVSASVQQSCNTDTWTTRLSVSARADTPPGTYTVTVDDGEGSAAFLLRVEDAAPPASTTSTVPRTTTTKPRATTTTPAATPTTTTTGGPTTTTPTTTTTTTTTTTAAAATIPNDGFVSVPELIKKGLPKTGLFLPLAAYAYRTCLPLTAPCTATDAPLVLLPARAYDVTWTATTPAAATTDKPPPAPPFAPVGQRPDGARTNAYALPLLDLATGRTATVTTLVRALDPRGNLVATPTNQPKTLQPAATPPPKPSPEPGTAPDGFSIFDRPRVIETASLTEASPVLVLLDGRVLYAVKADPSWGLGADVVPLFADGRVPYLVRPAQGPAGILVATSLGTGPPTAVVHAEVRRRNTMPWVVAAIALAGTGLAFTIVRRRRRHVPRDLPA